MEGRVRQLDPMDTPASEGKGDLWASAFTEARFPAYVISSEHQVIRANREGEAWLSQHGGQLPTDRPEKGMGVTEVPARGSVPPCVLVDLPDGSTLLCLGTAGTCSLTEQVRLYQLAAEQEERVHARDDRLEVYHELFTHDAPNFLTAIYGYLQMMQGQELPREKVQKYIDTSIRQVEALNHLIDNTRNLRTMESAPLSMVIPLDLGGAIAKAVATMQGPKSKPAEFHSSVALGAHKVMVEDQFNEVLRIVLNNAVAYAEKPVVSISVQDAGSTWNVRIADNGRGIPDDKKEFLFLRFHRLNKEKKIRGSGISLSLAKVLTERQGGRIWVENAVPGDYTKGSVFVIALPKA